MATIQVKVLQQLNEGCRQIRQTVFVEEQGFEEEFDHIDAAAHHVLLSVDGVPAATGRVFESDGKDVYRIGRVAVLKPYRKRRLGSKVIFALEKLAAERGAVAIVLSAQLRAEAFYQKLGYKQCGDVYLEENCPHVHMVKEIKM